MNLLKTKRPLFSRWPEQVELEGIKIPLKNSPFDPKTRRRLMRGSYETAERELVQQHIKPGDQVLELGASAGVVTCFLSRQIGPKGRLVCVEANVRLKAPFETQLDLNGAQAVWINALCCPLWQDQVPDRIAQQAFQPSEQTLSGRAVAGSGSGNITPWLTAVAICRQTQLEPSALVIDIEGSEAVWSEYAPSLPASIRLVLAEFHPHLIGSRVVGQALQAVLEEGFVVSALRGNVVALARR